MHNPSVLPYIEIAGSPRERGRQHGEQAVDRIRQAADFYVGLVARRGIDDARLRDLTTAFLPAIDAFDTSYVDEMRGIAEGAGIPFEHVVAINARRELLMHAKMQPDNLAPDGCTAAVVLPERSADGVLMHGQNWDWRVECADTCIVMKIRQEQGPDMLVFTEAGQLARSGFNAAGIAITGNNLESDRAALRNGVPIPFIRRKALETPHYAHAIRAVYRSPKAVANNMMLSHRDGEALDIECAPDESFLLHPEAGLLVHANHWESQVALLKLRESLPSPDSVYRGRRVLRHLTQAGEKVGFEDFRQAFLDSFGYPYAVCRPPQASSSGDHLSATAATILMRPAEGIMEVAVLPAVRPVFQRFTLQI
ncbi:acyl-CoA--6-aminopenicillanic acid acyltransferase [Alcaligenaceae bacterium]|nr:acyl-CoA--6-aminopenicillanic acid acyltransferase [Alcaligenaceae bacterium]